MPKKKETKEKEVASRVIVIPPIERKGAIVTVKALGDSTYIAHRKSERSMAAIKAKVTGQPKPKKFRNFDEEYEDCFYYTEDNEKGVPARAFEGSVRDAAVAANIPTTVIKRAVRVKGDIYPLRYKEIRRRVDYPKQSGQVGAPDIRHRPEFIDWECDVLVEYDASMITLENLAHLFNRAGFCSGVGDWRPSSPRSSGSHGLYYVEGVTDLGSIDTQG